MKRKTKIAFFATLAVLIASIFLTTCSFDKGSSGGGGDADKYFEFDNISRLSYMGGSVIYNPAVGGQGQISNGTNIAVRLSKVEINTSTSSPEDIVMETSYSFGYIKVDSVGVQSITLSYYEYHHSGPNKGKLNPAKNKTTTIALNDSGDINGDGKPDVTWAAPAFKRAGMEDAIFLTFIASQEQGNVGMYSVVPEQYARQAYPNGIMGVTPDGRLVVTAYQPNGARAASQGVEFGDIVVNHQENKYSTIKSGSRFRMAAERVGEHPDDIADVNISNLDLGVEFNFHEDGFEPAPSIGEGAVTGEDDELKRPVFEPAGPPAAVSPNVEVIADPDYFERDQFPYQVTPKMFFDALPASLKSSAPSTDTEYLNALNAILDMPPATVIDAVSADGVFEGDLTEFKTEIAGKSKNEQIAANRLFFAKAYPSLCLPPAPKTMQDMFPILSVSFSSGDSEEVVAEQLAEVRRANMELMYIMQQEQNGNARWLGQANKAAYEARRNDIRNNFNKNFTVLPGTPATFAKPIQDQINNHFNKASASITVGLYGSFVCYWGKIELGVGAAILLQCEISGPKAGEEKKFSQKLEHKTPITVGPVFLEVGLSAEFGVKTHPRVSMDNLFMGFIGLYGGRVWVGANYGVDIKWWWWIPYPSPYFYPYSTSQAISETVFYLGRDNPNIPMARTTAQITITPFVYIGPKLTLWNSIYGKVGVEAETPFNIYLNSGGNVGLNIDLAYGIKASTGIDFNFVVYRYRRDFAEWAIIPKTTYSIAKLNYSGLW